MKILFYPDKRYKKTRVGLGLKKIPDIKIGTLKDFDVAFHWNYSDLNETPEELYDLWASCKTVFNVHLNNVTKKHVDECFTEAFGYSSLVDPETHPGPFITKRNAQSRGNVQLAFPGNLHVINDGLYKYDPNYRIMQRIIRTETQGWCSEYRYLKFGDESFVVKKSKTIADRYRSNADVYKCMETKDVFSESQIEKIDDFCDAMGLDFGEVDILPENSTGRLYIVDVNNIAGGTNEKFFYRLADGEFAKKYILCLKKMLDQYSV